MMADEVKGEYEVLNPWAEVDPVPLRGISPRLTDIAGKRIGLFSTWKRAAKPILTAVEMKLKERYPDCETSWYMSSNKRWSALQMEGEDKTRFQEWVQGVDAVVAAIGD
jgi:hypothetical protein